MRESLTPSRLKPASPVARRAVQGFVLGRGATRPVTDAPTSSRAPACRISIAAAPVAASCSAASAVLSWLRAEKAKVCDLVNSCLLQERVLNACAARSRRFEVGSQACPRQSRLTRLDILGMQIGGAWPSAAPVRGVEELAARRDRVVVVVVASDARRGGDAGEGHVDRDGAPGRLAAAWGWSRPRGPILDTIPKSPARPTVSPVGDDAALWCFVSLRRATSHENQSTRRRGGRGSPRTT